MRLGSRIVAGIVAAVALLGIAAGAEAQAYRRWYLAEGAANTFFNDFILIGNPNSTAANVTIRLLPEGQPPFAPQQIVVQPTSRATFTVNGVVGLPPGAVSAIVESDVDIVVERSMTWPGTAQRGGHNSGGVLAPAGQWYLAEGVTGFFETFVLITNTNVTNPVTVEVTFLRQTSGPIVQTLTLPASGRRTIYVNNDVKDSLNRPIAEPFSTVVRQTGGGTSADLVVERAMYWNQFEGGHGSAAVTAPSTTWLFAEGVCGGDASFSFQTYLLLANPGTTDATATITFFRDIGGPVTKDVLVRAGRRETLFLNDLRFEPGNVAELANASFSMRVTSTQPVLAERAVYWSSNGITFIEGNNSPGVTAEATKWAFAEGIEGVVQLDGPSHDTYFLISNANATPLEIRATFVREDGHGIVVTRTIPAQSRGTILTSGIAALSHKRFAAFIESVNAPSPLPFVAERATYWGAGYYGGHGATGVPWTSAIATPPAVDLTPSISSISPTHGAVTGGNDITIRGANFTESTTVTIDNRPAQVFPIDATTLVVTVPAGAAAGSVPVSVTNGGFLPATDPNGYSYDPVGPLLLADTILAFGDSLTYGITSFCEQNCGGQTTGYPQRLENILRARFPAQAAAVQNAGVPGECASASCTGGTVAGRTRLPGAIVDIHDLVVILEGVNDTNAGPTDSFITNAIRAMVQTAKNAGKQVILCGLLPVKFRPLVNDYKASPSRIASMNESLAALARDEGVPFVDMVQAFGSAFEPLLSPDGLHPTDAGYQRMAEAVGNTVVQFFAVP
ncbi:MAG: GDSL-type esterase/lipase family protein [Vicinamibacteraceae bacterium]